MENTSRSPYGANNQLRRLFGIQDEVPAITTLNTKFNIFPSEALLSSDKPICKYVAIGNGGYYDLTVPPSVIEPARRKSTANALYNHMAWVVRPADNDLTIEEQARYRLRRAETHDGIDYIAYYLRVIELGGAEPVTEYREFAGELTTSYSYSPSSADLSPTLPDNVSYPQTEITSALYTYLTVPVEFTAADITQIEEGYAIQHPNSSDPSIVTEIGLCTGVDKNLIGEFNGVNISYTEAVGCQLFSATNVGKLMNFVNAPKIIDIDVGSVSPLYTGQA